MYNIDLFVLYQFSDFYIGSKRPHCCKRQKEQFPSEKPILTFTIDFETAKRYREANKMPHQFRRAAWTDLTVEVYL